MLNDFWQVGYRAVLKSGLAEVITLKVGGQASNNGVTFIGEKYRVWFKLGKDGTHKISYEKLIIKDAAVSFVRKIPFIRGIASIFRTRIVALIILVSISMELVERNVSEGPVLEGAMFIFMAVTLAMLACIIKTSIWKIREVWRFHGAEHKVIQAYNNGVPLTLEKVKGCTRVSRNCGTNFVVFLIFFNILLGFIFDSVSLRFVSAYVLAYELFCLDNGDTVPIISLFYKAGYFLQHHLFTREPTDIQLSAAIETMEKLIDLEGGARN